MIKITILGCGSSVGTPLLSCRCDVCSSTEKKNKRQRSSILVESDNTRILIDFGYDIRNQLLSNKIEKLDAVLLTHFHADHVSGFPDLKPYPLLSNTTLPIYIENSAVQYMKTLYSYMFADKLFKIKIINYEDSFIIGDIPLRIFKQHHGKINSMGIRIKNFIYANDVSDFPQESKKYLYNAEYLIIDCIKRKSVLAHAGLDKVTSWVKEFLPQKTFLTNLSHEIEYHSIKKELPRHIEPAFDNMKIVIH